MSVTGAATFTTSNTSTITLNDGSNDFSTFDVGSTGDTVGVTDTDGIDLAAMSVGSLTVNAGGLVTDSGVITNTSVSISTSGNVTLNDDQTFTTFSISGGNVSLTHSGAIDLGTTTATGTLDVVAGGAISMAPRPAWHATH